MLSYTSPFCCFANLFKGSEATCTGTVILRGKRVLFLVVLVSVPPSQSRREAKDGMRVERQMAQASSATQHSWKACPQSNTVMDGSVRPTLSARGSVQHPHVPKGTLSMFGQPPAKRSAYEYLLRFVVVGPSDQSSLQRIAALVRCSRIP